MNLSAFLHLKSSRQQWLSIDDTWFTEDKTCFMILLKENQKKKQPRFIRHFYLSSLLVKITPFIWIFLDLPFTQLEITHLFWKKARYLRSEKYCIIIIFMFLTWSVLIVFITWHACASKEERYSKIEYILINWTCIWNNSLIKNIKERNVDTWVYTWKYVINTLITRVFLNVSFWFTSSSILYVIF